MTKEEFEKIIKPIMLLNGKESQFIRTALLGNFQKWNEQKQLIIADVVDSETELVCDCQDPANGYKSMTCKIHNNEELWIGEQTN